MMEDLDPWQKAEFQRLCRSIRRIRNSFFHDGNYVKQHKILTDDERFENAHQIHSYLKEADDLRVSYAEELKQHEELMKLHLAPSLEYSSSSLVLELQTDLFMTDYVRGFMKGINTVGHKTKKGLRKLVRFIDLQLQSMLKNSVSSQLSSEETKSNLPEQLPAIVSPSSVIIQIEEDAPILPPVRYLRTYPALGSPRSQTCPQIPYAPPTRSEGEAHSDLSNR